VSLVSVALPSPARTIPGVAAAGIEIPLDQIQPLIALGVLLVWEEISPATSLGWLVETGKVSLAALLQTEPAPCPKGIRGEAELATTLGAIAIETTLPTDEVSIETTSFILALLTRRPRLAGSSTSCAKVSSRRPPSHVGLAIATSFRGDTAVAAPMKP
jgi:hypothetical protein